MGSAPTGQKQNRPADNENVKLSQMVASSAGAGVLPQPLALRPLRMCVSSIRMASE